MKIKPIICCIIILLMGCDPRYGIIESSFDLAPGSRLPKWFDSRGINRSEFIMKITFYTPLFGKDVNVKCVLYKVGVIQYRLDSKVGKFRWHPHTEKYGFDKYPIYSIITVDGISEIFVKKEPGPVLYITDEVN